jgi:hypothetical protein
MKKSVHKNTKGWKLVATAQGVQIHSPNPNWIYLIGCCVQAIVAFVGLWTSRLMSVWTAMGLSLLAGMLVWWFLGVFPDFSFKSRGFTVLGSQKSERKFLSLSRLVLVSDPQHKDVVIVNPGTDGIFPVWVAESEEDRLEVVRALRRYIRKETSFSEQVPGLYSRCAGQKNEDNPSC